MPTRFLTDAAFIMVIVPTRQDKKTMNQCIVVTGGAGFVGSNLVRKLQNDHPDTHIVVIDDMRCGTFLNLVGQGDDDFRFQGDLVAQSVTNVDWNDLIGRLKPSAIYHEASITDTTVSDQAKMISDNVDPFRRLLDTAVATGVKLVWASSAGTYGMIKDGHERRPFRIADAGRPANVYGFSKWAMENLHRQVLAAHPDAHVVALRYFNVFGPGEQNKQHMASMVYRLALQMLDGKRPRIFHDGQQARDQVYVGDVVEATIAAAADGARSGIYNVGSGKATTFNEIIEALNTALGTTLEPDYFENPYDFYQSYTCADLSETEAGLAWRPHHDVRQAIIEYAGKIKSNVG